MKKRINILLLVWGLNIIFPLYGQEIFEAGERYPFNSPPATAQNGQLLQAPGAGGPVIPPPTEEDKVGGSPVRDAFWIFPLLALGYSIYVYRKRKITPKSPKGDFSE